MNKTRQFRELLESKELEVGESMSDAIDIDLVIWANHNLRVCVSAMQETSRPLEEERSLRNFGV